MMGLEENWIGSGGCGGGGSEFVFSSSGSMERKLLYFEGRWGDTG